MMRIQKKSSPASVIAALFVEVAAASGNAEFNKRGA
jgi:hypothetical protein